MNKKGFTLIELLAVIVILAIIALIAVPIVLNMIENARRSAAKSSAYGYIQAIDDNNELVEMNDDYGLTKEEIKGTNIPVSSINLKVKGKKPSSGTVTIEKGRVSNATLCINNYTVTYNGTEATVGSKGCGGGNSTPTYAVGDIINYNPETNKSCSNPISATGRKTGCMKWYVIKESGTNDSTVDVILDHNTTAGVQYETSGSYKEYEQASIKATVDADTTGWTSGLNPRLITADEIVAITNTNTFDGSSSTWFYFNGTGDNKQTSVSSSQGDNEYAWLFDYTNGCDAFGCNTADSSNYGYWTSTSVYYNSGNAWKVNNNGTLRPGDVNDVVDCGVRPVITINKSAID